MRRIVNAALSGLYPILDSRLVPKDQMAPAARILAQCGVEQLQLRMKRDSDADRLRVQDAVSMALEGTGTLLVINDRSDLARMLSREAPPGVRVGLHLGQDDMDPRRARDIVGDGIHMSWSTHTLEQVEASAGLPLDGLAYGPVFDTANKENPDATVGVAGLTRAASAAPWPLTAIGGIDAGTVALCMDAGAASVAVIGALFGAFAMDDLQRRTAMMLSGAR